VYHELVLTTREYCHNVTAVEPKWLVEVAPQFFKVADANKISKRKRQEKIEPLFNKYEKPDEWRLSKVKRSARSVSCFHTSRYFSGYLSYFAESNIWLRRTSNSCCDFVFYVAIIRQLWIQPIFPFYRPSHISCPTLQVIVERGIGSFESCIEFCL